MTTDAPDPSGPDAHDPSVPDAALPPDEVALPAFEDALWAALRAEHARGAAGVPLASTSTTDDVEVLDPAQVLAPVALPSPRRRARRALAAAAAVVVLGAAAGLALRAGGDGSDEQRPVATDPATTEPTTTLALELQVADVLTDLAATRVVGTEQRRGGVLVRRSWADQTSGALHGIEYRSDGESPGFELGLADPIAAGDGLLVDPVLRAVDHCARQHSEDVGPTMSGADDLSRLAQGLREGQAIVDGTEVVEGRELLVLRPVHTPIEMDMETGETSIPDPPVTTVETYLATYLDPETYEPVAERVFAVGDRPEEVTTFTLSPRSEEGLDLLVAHAPEGYTAVEAVRTNEQRALGGCL